MIELILIKNFYLLGKKNDFITVKYSYAINYLIPKKIAIIKTKDIEFKLKEKIDKIKKLEEIKIKNFEILKKKIEFRTINIKVKYDKNGKLFGSINLKNIINIINNINNVNFIKEKNIILKNNKIQKIGTYKIIIKKFNKEILFNLEVK